MRDAIDPTVQRAIVHLINHRKQDLVRSDAELPLNGNDKLREYFSKQVKNALGDGQTGSALFSTDGDQSANQESYRIIDEDKRFIPSSQELARLLFEAMGTDARIKPASLAVCLYTASNYPSATFLALIKIDPTEALIERVETQNAKTVVTFDVRNDVMPTSREKLQKAALIPPKGTVENLDLLLLDQQVAAVAANFFALKFLNTIPVLDPRTSTKDFLFRTQKALKMLTSAPKSAPEHIEPKEAEAYLQRTEVAMQSPTVNRDEFVKDLQLSPKAEEVVAKQLKERFPEDIEIQIDPQYAQETLLKKKRYRGDFGVLFEVDSDHYDEVVTDKKEKTRPDGTIITRLVLDVPNFHWVR